jgi:hypothetical protein
MTTKGAKQLALVQPTVPPPPPPELGPAGAALWRDTLEAWDISGADLAIFTQACHAADVAERLRRKIEDDGDALASGGSIKANPLLTIELQARALMARLLGRLLKPGPTRGPGRPPKQGGW